MPALAITDAGNLFGALEFSQTASEARIQRLVGCYVLCPEQTFGIGILKDRPCARA